MFNNLKSIYNNLKRRFVFNLFHEVPKPIVKIKKKINGKQMLFFSGGDLNKNKVFYVIQRYNAEGAFFSDLVFVINNLKIADDYGFIPIVDMQNFPRWYNESTKIKKTLNSWNYYFDSVSNYSLEEVYKSKNIILSNKTFYTNFGFKYKISESEELKNIYKKYVRIDRKILKISEYFSEKNFKNNKILGVHFRGTSYKWGKNPYPATINQMKKKIKKILKDDQYDKIFLVTEDINNFDELKKEFSNKLIYLKNSFRDKGTKAFTDYPRLNHRYKLGRDLLVETILLSKCDGYLDTPGNVGEAVRNMNLNILQKKYLINNGFNPGLPILGNYLWYLKSFLPDFLGGFKDFD